MPRHHNFGLQFLGAGNGRVEVVELKPEENAVSVWFKIWVTDGTVVMLHFPFVQLQDQPTIRNQTLILRAAVRALAAQKTLIPATARLNVAHADERLWTHEDSVLTLRSKVSSHNGIARLHPGQALLT
jgi:hypothetical protein